MELTIPDYIRRAFVAGRAAEARQEAQEAADLRADFLSLIEQPGWKRLIKDLTDIEERVYTKLVDGTATDADRALGKTIRLLKQGPEKMLEYATGLLGDVAGRSQNG